MRRFISPLLVTVCLLTLSACSVFGDVSVKIAPYEVIEADGDFEVRYYERLVLVSTDMPDGIDRARSPFFTLFDYISGNNTKTEKIAMTAPVFMDQSEQKTEAMSFVLPTDFSLATTPSPLDPAAKLTELKDYRVAVISFSGLLNQETISTHQTLLLKWIADKGFKVAGTVKAAGYNPPFTLPFLRRNEIVIPI